MAVFWRFIVKNKTNQVQEELVNTCLRRDGWRLIQAEFWAATALELIFAGWWQNVVKFHAGGTIYSFCKKREKKRDFGQKIWKIWLLAPFVG